MRTLITTILTLMCALLAHSAPVQTPAATKSILSCITELSQLQQHNVNRANELQQNIKACFADNLNLRGNEFFMIGLDKRSNITSSAYGLRLKQYLFTERNLSIDCKIQETIPVKAIDLGKDAVVLYVTHVNKHLVSGNRAIDIWQEYEVDIANGKITCLKTSDKAPKKNEFISTTDDEPKSVHEYLSEAAKLYTKKNYDAAHQLYAELTQKYSSEAEGWYRLSLMVYSEKGCKGKYKSPSNTAIEYMERAAQLATGKLKEKAENAKHIMKHPNYL